MKKNFRLLGNKVLDKYSNKVTNKRVNEIAYSEMLKEMK